MTDPASPGPLQGVRSPRQRVRSLGQGLTALVFAVLAAGPALAEPVPIDRAVLVLVRTLAYDRLLDNRVGAEVRIGVVAPPADPGVAAAAREALGRLTGVTVAGRPLAAPRLHAGVDAFDEWLAREEIDVVLVCPGLGDTLVRLARDAEARRALVLALDGADVGHGAAIGVSEADGRVQIRVDVAAARRAGADLSSELLDLAARVP